MCVYMTSDGASGASKNEQSGVSVGRETAGVMVTCYYRSTMLLTEVMNHFP